MTSTNLGVEEPDERGVDGVLFGQAGCHSRVSIVSPFVTRRRSLARSVAFSVFSFVLFSSLRASQISIPSTTDMPQNNKSFKGISTPLRPILSDLDLVLIFATFCWQFLSEILRGQA